ncbi:acyl-CoA reductase [Bacteroidota bacterium]
MKIESRKEGLFKLGDTLNSFIKEPDFDFLEKIRQSNQWFIPEFILRSIDGIRGLLNTQNIEKWLSDYTIPDKKIRKVGIIMAGNIPLVGFHDLLSVIISGHHAVIKTSHLDSILTKWVVEKLYAINPEFKTIISFTDRIKYIDALIATGSDNSARYFQYNFKALPAIIRKNRSSIAILNGNEDEGVINSIADDIFLYFGLGCRNVSKLFVPEDFNNDSISSSLKRFEFLQKHKGYKNNYNQQKAINSISDGSFHDGGFYLMKKSTGFISPVSVIYYEDYENRGQLENKIRSIADKIQCIISTDYPNSISPGEAQYPELWDYADNVDTMTFLTTL